MRSNKEAKAMARSTWPHHALRRQPPEDAVVAGTSMGSGGPSARPGPAMTIDDRRNQMFAEIHSLSRLFGNAPTCFAAGWPFLNRISVGMPCTA